MKCVGDQWLEAHLCMLHLVPSITEIETQGLAGLSGFWKHTCCTWYIPPTHLSGLLVSRDATEKRPTVVSGLSANCLATLTAWVVLKNMVCSLATPAEGHSTALQDPGVRPRFLQQKTSQALGMFLGPRRDWTLDYASPRDQADLLMSWALSDPQSYIQTDKATIHPHRADIYTGCRFAFPVFHESSKAIMLGPREYLIHCHVYYITLPQVPHLW